MSDADIVRVGDVWRDRHGYGRRVMVNEFKWPYAYVVSSTSRRHTRIHQATLAKRFSLVSRLP